MHINTGSHWATTITDLQGNETEIGFESSLKTSRVVYQGSTSGTLLRTVHTCYNGASYPCYDTLITLPITQRTVATVDPVAGTWKVSTIYDTNSRLTETDEYDYGQSTATRKTLTSYKTFSNNPNILNRPEHVYVKDGSNNL